MKKGRLSINNQNGLVCNVFYNGTNYRLKNKEITFDGNLLQLDNAEVDFEMERGKITTIIHRGIAIYKIAKAQAPYNFVTLNENETFIDCDYLHINKYYSQEDGFYNGYIDMEANNKTAIFVRGTLNHDLKDQSFFKTQNGDKVRIDNYSPAGELGLPGSSIRGMIRNMVEIATFGKFGFINNDVLYFRSFADDCINLRNMYNDCVGSSVENIKTGLIFKEGRFFKLIEGDGFKKINRTNSAKQYFRRISEGHYIVHSGHMNGKLYDLEIRCKEDKSKATVIPESDVRSYINDTNRASEAINIIKEAGKNDFVPCFYFEGEDGQITFGHTRFFRIPYFNSISDCIYEELTDKTITDLVDVMFGDTSHAGKLYFEDLNMIKGKEDEESVPKILSSPKPTSFQLYLEQGDREIKDLIHYDSDNALIRGNKLYWHKSNNLKWKADEDQQQLISKVKNGQDKQHTIIKPIKEGAVFSGRIRFENLSTIELGALLFVLKLKDGWCHKIGMAKPLGLGTLQINPTLHLSDREKRYRSLNAEWGNIDVISDETTISNCIQKFMDAVWGITDSKSKGKDLWEHPRLKQLAIMLDWENKPEDSLTEYMNLSDFKHRMVLPTPSEVIKQKRL